MVNLFTCAAKLLGVLLLTPLIAVDALEHSLPSRFPRCKKSELNTNKCSDTLIDVALHLAQNGIPELGVPTLDPLELTEINVGESGGPVSLSVKFSNVVITGLTNATFSNIKFNFDDKANMSIIFTGAAKYINFESDYEMSGRMLLVPLSGKGRCRINYEDMNSSLGPVGKIVTVKGKEYFNVTHFFTKLHSVGKVDFHFDNLFNGDKGLASPTLQLINDNWQQLWGELLPVFVEVFGTMDTQLAKRVFDRVPFNDIFPE